MESDCKKMREHIDFVENVYDNVKTPFNYVMNSVSSIIYNDTPKISNTNNANEIKFLNNIDRDIVVENQEDD